MNHSFRFLPHIPPTRRPASILLAVALALLAFAVTVATSAARATGEHHRLQRLVVRGDSTAVDGPCDARACRVDLADGHFRATPIGTGAYTASLALAVADAFPNGEGGMCAPLDGRIVLGAGTPDRLVLDVSGDSTPRRSPASRASRSATAAAASRTPTAAATRRSSRTRPTTTG